MVTMTVKLPPATSARLTAVARTRRVSKSQIVREAIERHLQSAGKKHRPSFYELTSDLLGCYKGKYRDLSTNPKHLEGYGE
jgi:geranylgeranyl pyrophosphate synthase